jgi:hypothetical protein
MWCITSTKLIHEQNSYSTNPTSNMPQLDEV